MGIAEVRPSDVEVGIELDGALEVRDRRRSRARPVQQVAEVAERDGVVGTGSDRPLEAGAGNRGQAEIGLGDPQVAERLIVGGIDLDRPRIALDRGGERAALVKDECEIEVRLGPRRVRRHRLARRVEPRVVGKDRRPG